MRKNVGQNYERWGIADVSKFYGFDRECFQILIFRFGIWWGQSGVEWNVLFCIFELHQVHKNFAITEKNTFENTIRERCFLCFLDDQFLFLSAGWIESFLSHLKEGRCWINTFRIFVGEMSLICFGRCYFPKWSAMPAQPFTLLVVPMKKHQQFHMVAVFKARFETEEARIRRKSKSFH